MLLYTDIQFHNEQQIQTNCCLLLQGRKYVDISTLDKERREIVDSLLSLSQSRNPQWRVNKHVVCAIAYVSHDACRCTNLHTCGCPREAVFAVNYELNKPAGSRCAEQVALGMLASKGIDQTAIRDIYVLAVDQGSEAEEPNPLGPCSVCIGMFGKICELHELPTTVFNVYMFDSINPSTLIKRNFGSLTARQIKTKFRA
eukprot:NODE_1565_length_1126_cov_41.458682_g1274_i0.p1 GENE.NODE_1565_length_1126_cov_41.458682_g1274_i0~~NODE_1565_length_1126_cov_41.458682_g1274_i0.p1  ORF type:complete len:200 (-),score=33.35 NODE_1565_length_1126_cov_41.458682_g1274_i0:76-675(-)